MPGWAQTPPVHGSVGWECGGPSAEPIWADRRAADCTGARVKGKIFQVEIVWWITQGLDRTIKHSVLGGDLIRQEAEESWSVAGRGGGWGRGGVYHAPHRTFGKDKPPEVCTHFLVMDISKHAQCVMF